MKYTCDIDSVQLFPLPLHQLDAPLGRVHLHDLLDPLGAALHVAVGAGLVAVEPDVQLEDLGRTAVEEV